MTVSFDGIFGIFAFIAVPAFLFVIVPKFKELPHFQVRLYPQNGDVEEDVRGSLLCTRRFDQRR